MNKIIALLTFAILGGGFIHAQDEFDDIYFNPKIDNKPVKKETKSNSRPNYYVADFGNVDVDAYNRRGEFYYNSPIDTVGTAAGTADDFVYTQQIQKFYNPTIVVDNAELLEDVLDNSYGNVEVVYNGFSPVFAPAYYSYGWPYYGYAYRYNPWYWGNSWNLSWSWGPSWSWNWGWGGPGWGWGWTSPSWGYPGWGWGGGWYPEYHRKWMANHYRPHGNSTVAARPGWSTANRPVSNGTPGYSGSHRRGIAAGGTYRPSTGNSYNYNNHRNSGTSGTYRYNGNSRPSIQHRPSGTTQNNGSHRYSGSNSSTGKVNGGNTTTRPRTTTTPSRSGATYNNGGNHRSSGNSGSYRSSGGGSRTSGGSRGGGGGGHRR